MALLSSSSIVATGMRNQENLKLLEVYLQFLISVNGSFSPKRHALRAAQLVEPPKSRQQEGKICQILPRTRSQALVDLLSRHAFPARY